MANKQLPCPTLLRQLVSYDPKTGKLFHKKNGKQAANTVHIKGYRYGNVAGRSFLAHRLAWIIYNGEYPSGYIDHKNGNKTDNRIANLRDVLPGQNSANRFPTKGSNSKYLGVCFVAALGKFKSAITKNGKTKHLGLFSDEIEAAKAYDKAAREIHGEFSRPNF